MSSLLKSTILATLILAILAALTWVNLRHVRDSDSNAAAPAAAVQLTVVSPGEAA